MLRRLTKPSIATTKPADAEKSTSQAVQPEPSKLTLADLDPEARSIGYAEWKARQLNRLFAEHGVIGESGHIESTTVMDGLSKANYQKERWIIPVPPNQNPSPTETETPRFNEAELNVTRRPKGQTVTFGLYEWIYNPNGITEDTRHQIGELTAKGEGPIRVIQWPAGDVIFRDGKWKDGADDDGRNAAVDKTDEEAKEGYPGGIEKMLFD